MRIETKKELLILAFFFQLFLVVVSNAYKLVDVMSIQILGMPTNVITLLNILSVLLTLYLVINVLNLTRKEQELFSVKKQQKQAENLTAFLRELKHDVNNQLFVVNGLMQLGKVQEAAKYAQEINEQFDWMEDLLALNQPELASLVLSKLLEAKNLGINVEATIETKQIPNYPGDVFIKALGNLLDNAIHALVNKDGEKKLSVDIYSLEDKLLIAVENSGEIPEEIRKKMFERGYTTKPEQDGHGLGLHIVSSLMRSIGGQVTHKNEQGTTIFELDFPM